MHGAKLRHNHKHSQGPVNYVSLFFYLKGKNQTKPKLVALKKCRKCNLSVSDTRMSAEV